MTEVQTNIFDVLYPTFKFSKHHKIKMFECFSGIGCQKMALERVTKNFEIVGISEIDKYAIKSYQAMHGENIKNYGDISQIKGTELPEIDILTYSFPCFTKDTLVLTENGNKSISDVKVDELVLTHTNEYKKVLKVMNNGLKETIKINAMAIDEIVTTSNHKFYVRDMKRKYLHNPNRSYRTFLEPRWEEAKNLTKHTYLGVGINQLSELPILDDELENYKDKKEFWYILGRYIGDGWLRATGGIVICGNEQKIPKIVENLDKLNIHYNVVKERTVYKVHIPRKKIGDYFKTFGSGAINKHLTKDVINLPCNLLESFIQGYVDSDGYTTDKLTKISSISKILIYDVAQCIAKVYKTPYRIYKIKKNLLAL